MPSCFHNVLQQYSSPPQLRYLQLHYFHSYAILNWVQKNSSWAIFLFADAFTFRLVFNFLIVKLHSTVGNLLLLHFEIIECCTVVPHSYGTSSYAIFKAILFLIGSKKTRVKLFPSLPTDAFTFRLVFNFLIV